MMRPTTATASRTPTATKASVLRSSAAAPPSRPAHVDSKVAARNAALNIAGGVKVDVFIRVRPHLAVDGAADDIVKVDGNEITAVDAKGADVFKFDKVFPTTVGQEDMYDQSMRSIVDQVSRGLGKSRTLRSCRSAGT